MIFAARIATLIAATLTPQAGGLGSTPPSLPAVVQAQGPPGAGPALPEDPFVRCATKALRGDFGPLKPWQAHAYRAGLLDGKPQRFVVTCYWGSEVGGTRDRRGNRCTLKTAASNVIPYGRYVWTERTGVRQVLDCGSRANDPNARRIGGERAVWLDAWQPSASAARKAGLGGWTPQEGMVMR